MPQFHIKIPQYNVYLRKYKLVSPTECKIVITEDFEEAGSFDSDDYILQMLKEYNVELLPSALEDFPPVEEIVPKQKETIPVEVWI